MGVGESQTSSKSNKDQELEKRSSHKMTKIVKAFLSQEKVVRISKASS